jgi:hypothetical protein
MFVRKAVQWDHFKYINVGALEVFSAQIDFGEAKYASVNLVLYYV